MGCVSVRNQETIKHITHHADATMELCSCFAHKGRRHLAEPAAASVRTTPTISINYIGLLQRIRLGETSYVFFDSEDAKGADLKRIERGDSSDTTLSDWIDGMKSSGRTRSEQSSEGTKHQFDLNTSDRF